MTFSDILQIITLIALFVVMYIDLKQAKRIDELEDYLFGEDQEHAEGGTD